MIKLFEEYNQYYTEINSIQYYELGIIRENFTKNEVNIIKSMYPICDPLSRINSRHAKLAEVKLRVVQIYLIDKRNIQLVTISKSKDEWYAIKIPNTITSYYKCDQFEGLLKFLSDNDEKFKKYDKII